MASLEYILNRASMIALLVAGIIFIYEGIKYFKMKKENPEIPDKIYAAAVLALIIGLAEVGFGIAHFWMKT